MRPIQLKMTAFGCYATETAVDFTKFDHGLYLIVGKTGAGKTTIFDAVSFALFGVPSGASRTNKMLHSDFVPLSRDTVVELVFEHQGHTYTVRRTIHFVKKRGVEDTYEEKLDAAFTSDSEVIKGSLKVTNRCVELLGLNADQFRRIVMLAQGEFLRFLNASSDEKNKILGKLFDNSEYLRLQTLLNDTRKKLERRRQGATQEMAMALDLLALPEGTGHPEDYLLGNPHLVENLERLVGDEEGVLATLHEEHAGRSKMVEDLSYRIGTTESINMLLDELRQKKDELASLEANEASIVKQEQEYAMVERAVRHVAPCVERHRQSVDALRQTQDSIARSVEALREQEGILAKAQSAVDADADKEGRVAELAAESKALEDALPRYDQLADKEGHLASEREEQTATRRLLGQLDNEYASISDELVTLRQEISELEGSGEEAERLRQQYDQARERLDAVVSPRDGIMAQMDDIAREQAMLDDATEELRQLTQDAYVAEERRHDLYKRFIDGQAGLIAADLERELSENGQATCPVCNSAFCDGEAHHFAVPMGEVPTKQQVDLAEAEARETERRRQDWQRDIDRRQGLVGQHMEGVVTQVRQLSPDCRDWEMLTGEGYLASLRSQLERVVSDAEQAYESAKARSDRRGELLRQEPERAKRRADLEQERVAVQARAGEIDASISGLESAIEQLRASLEYSNKDAARQRIDELVAELDGLRQDIDKHRQAFSAAQSAYDGMNGSLRAFRNALPEQEMAVRDREAELSRAMSENGFDGMADFERVMTLLDGDDGEQWLTSRRGAIDEHRRQVEMIQARVTELTEQTRGKRRVDMEELREGLRVAKQAQSDISETMSERQSVLDRHRDICKRVKVATEELDKTETAWQRIGRLSSLAVGANSDTGKLSFDRYVMGAIFKEVLDMANRRLDIMTGGRFELIHVVSATRKNARSGLETEILDRETGKRRPSKSISGGEGFLVSLALALGLSDVVQSHAGGQKLDTLFIDEGFGTLDDGKLDSVIAVLNQLAEGNRLIGVISHVDKLEESIPHKLRVASGPHGSSLQVEVS